MGTAGKILERIKEINIINTHSHHLPDELLLSVDLTYLLSNSYTIWMSQSPEINDYNSINQYINKYRCNTYFRWLFAALEELYGIKVCAENFIEINNAIINAYKDSSHHLDILRKNCRFERIVNERQPDPGSNLNHPELFSPSFRCDCYFSGYLKDKPEPNGFYAYSTFKDENISSLKEYIEQMNNTILNKKKAGCVALKVAIAYERPLEFVNTDYYKAAKAFNNNNATEDEIIAFGDYIMFELAKIAARNNIPLQIHTGMGQLKATNPIKLLKLIESNPETKFHLLHGGFPWFADTYAFLHNYKNVWSDTCWIPYLSSHSAKDYLITALEVSDSERLTWGCDTWMSEDAFGALLAMEHTLSKALGEMADDGAFDIDYAVYLSQRILYQNGKELFSGC